MVSGGEIVGDELVSEVWRLDPATLQWVPMSALVAGRRHHACCLVRKTLVVLGEIIEDGEGNTSKVEILSGGQDRVFTDFPTFSCGGIVATIIAVEENDSAAGQVLVLGGCDEEDAVLLTVHLVDLATGVCSHAAGCPP